VPYEPPGIHHGSASSGSIAAYGRVGDGGTGVCAEKLGNLVLDAGDDLAVEESDHGGDQEGAEDDGDNNLDTFADVEVAVFVVECFLCGILQILSLEICLGGESSDSVCHRKNPFVLKKCNC